MPDSELRASYPAIPWDQPIRLAIASEFDGWACRYCIAREGLTALDVLAGNVPYVFQKRTDCELHISSEHGHA